MRERFLDRFVQFALYDEIIGRVVNPKELSIMRYQDDINTEDNMKSIGRAAVAQWTKRLTRSGQTRFQIREAHIFDITVEILNFVENLIYECFEENMQLMS